jgi:hypothetical protein
MKDTDRNSRDRASQPGQFDWGIAMMFVTLFAVSGFLLLEMP